ncbi:DUF3761 domain-containing protein [Streptomyces sp. NPDC127190]|uniref:DUF3761 domain-containing protein n=1 Tax=unclassified Streptomyces TaxID=2593676 RepID=UPI00362EFDF7
MPSTNTAHHTTGVCGWTHGKKPSNKYETAKCKDASPSYSRHSPGTCSHHHGVRYWFKPPPARVSRPVAGRRTARLTGLRGPAGRCAPAHAAAPTTRQENPVHPCWRAACEGSRAFGTLAPREQTRAEKPC